MESKYPLAIRILHWLMAAIILCLLAAGLIMTDMSHDNPWRSTVYSLHKSFGITILLLALLRLFFRLSSRIPPLPKAIPAIERHMGELAHYALYGFMFAMPLSGYIMSASFGLPVKWFGVALPRLVSVDKARGALAADIHSYAGYALMGLIALHVCGVIKHYAKERINLLTRMT